MNAGGVAAGAGGVILVNPASGPGSSPVDEVKERFTTARVVTCEGDDLEATAQEEVAARPDFIGVAGGDGSIRCVAGLLAGTGIPLLPVPTGTRNHFSRELGIETVADAAAAVGGTRRAVDLAEVNGERFVNNASIGFYAAMVRERGRHERRLPPMVANAAAAWAQARRGHRFRVAVNGANQRAWLVFVGNGCYGEGLTDLIHRDALDQALLDVRVLRADVALARTRTVLALLLGRLTASSLLVQREECDVEVTLRTPTVSVALDGEVVQLASPLRFRSLPGALTVLVPPGADAKVGA
ncbi:MAG: diacylglycerol/lipid kinase family protein [Actinomycetota bacterium]